MRLCGVCRLQHFPFVATSTTPVALYLGSIVGRLAALNTTGYGSFRLVPDKLSLSPYISQQSAAETQALAYSWGVCSWCIKCCAECYHQSNKELACHKPRNELRKFSN